MSSETFEKLDVEMGDIKAEIFSACELGQLESIEAMLSGSLERSVMYTRNKADDTLIHVASANGHLELVRFLLENGASVSSSGQNGDRPLHSAARNGHLQVVTFLKDQGADMNCANEAGDTAVHVATRQGHLHVVEFLRLSGADVNIQNSRGSTALHIACQMRNTPMALMLLHLGCSLNLVDKMGEIALHEACHGGMLSVIQTLCSYGCKVDIENKAGLSPLHVAAKTGNAEIVRCLLLSGADIDKYNEDGVRAEDIALAQGHSDVADLLGRLSASITQDKCDAYIKQLMPTNSEISCLKIKVFGSSGVGKSTLIDSLKCGYIRSLFRRVYSTYSVPVQSKEPYAIKPRRKQTLQVPYEGCTKGINVEQASLSDAGEVSIWEFSGYEPYYGVYDHFIGDPNCLHIVVISLNDKVEDRILQLNFWLNFIRARVTPAEPFGSGGNQLWAPHVLLVATHGDIGEECLWNAKGELVMIDEAKILSDVEVFHTDLILSRKFLVLDARKPFSTEMKNLRMTIAKSKELIAQYLPMSLGFLDNTVGELPNWNKMLPAFPVVKWSSFMEYIRTRVNLLATEEHLKELVYQLQIVGEIIYLESEKEDLVIINPQWLGTEIIGKLFSYECLASAAENGRMSLDEIRLLFPRLDGSDLVNLLEALCVCIQCSKSGEKEYIFPALNVIENPSMIWTNAELGDDTVAGGMRVGSPPQFGQQFTYIYPRVVIGFFHAARENKDLVICEWSSECKLQMDGMSAVVSLVENGSAFHIECRAMKTLSANLFGFQQMIYDIIAQVFQQSCPGIYLEQNPVSPAHLVQRKPIPHIYKPHDILLAQYEGRSTLQLDVNTTETLVDVIAFGSNELYSTLRPGIDLHISNVSLYTRCQLAALLDKHFQSTGEQEKFATLLEIDKSRLSESVDSDQLSNTDKMLALWSQSPTATIRLLCQKFNEFNRSHATTLLLSLSPMYTSTTLNKII